MTIHAFYSKEKFCFILIKWTYRFLDFNADGHLKIYYHVIIIQISMRLTFTLEENSIT